MLQQQSAIYTARSFALSNGSVDLHNYMVAPWYCSWGDPTKKHGLYHGFYIVVPNEHRVGVKEEMLEVLTWHCDCSSNMAFLTSKHDVWMTQMMAIGGDRASGSEKLNIQRQRGLEDDVPALRLERTLRYSIVSTCDRWGSCRGAQKITTEHEEVCDTVLAWCWQIMPCRGG